MSIFRKCLSKTRALWKSVSDYFFCQHEWDNKGSHRYAVIREDGSKEGEVTLTSIECSKCREGRIIATDRTHEPRA